MSEASSDPASTPSSAGLVGQAKDLIGDECLRLRLFDLVASEARQFCARVGGDDFSVATRWDITVFQERVANYERESADLLRVQALLGHWATEPSSPCLTIAPARVVDHAAAQNGNTGWLALRWYPALLLLYAGGIGAVTSGNYQNLNRLLSTCVSWPGTRGDAQPFVKAVIEGIADVADGFKALPGHDRDYVPRSEYLFAFLRQPLDSVLSIGSDYERVFDRFEMILTLEEAHQSARDGQDVGPAPLGRFAWKYGGHHNGDPFSNLAKEAGRHGSAWPPLLAGLFGGSYDRFLTLHQRYGEVIGRTGWRW